MTPVKARMKPEVESMSVSFPIDGLT